ncbi:MAG: glycerol-3-phosphate 1-O-acyltransferase PlsY [Puniceicoccales bacterium]|nr:glycerol-3-phosphate 1-O-acyltransferase PlsY [Puniceicoccales bacterium]
MPAYLLLPAIAGVVGYLIGSISFAVIVARRHGVDILKAGSGNPGATNVKRVCGKKPGNIVFGLDVLKGMVASGWPGVLAWIITDIPEGWFSPNALLYAQLTGFAGAVLGHCFSLFLKFKGGKGVSVSVGGLCGTLPPCLVVSAFTWLFFYFTTRYVSVASLVAAASLPVTAALWWDIRDPRFYLCIGIAIFVFFTHRSNIKRLLRGEESRFSKKRDEEAKP